MDAQRIKGHVDALLLATLAHGPLHGYGVITEMRARSGGAVDLPEGTVYPALHKLEVRGLLESRWDATAPRRRRVYVLTDAGRAALAAERTAWVQFTSGVASLLAFNRVVPA